NFRGRPSCSDRPEREGSESLRPWPAGQGSIATAAGAGARARGTEGRRSEGPGPPQEHTSGSKSFGACCLADPCCPIPGHWTLNSKTGKHSLPEFRATRRSPHLVEPESCQKTVQCNYLAPG